MVKRRCKGAIVYKDLIISTIVDCLVLFPITFQVYKDLIISTIVDLSPNMYLLTFSIVMQFGHIIPLVPSSFALRYISIMLSLCLRYTSASLTEVYRVHNGG